MPTRSRTVLSYSTLLRRCAATRPGLIGPATPGGSTVEPAVPGPPLLAPILPVQPTRAAAIAAMTAIPRVLEVGLHEGQTGSVSTGWGMARHFLSNEYAPSAISVVPLSGSQAKKSGQLAGKYFAGSPD